MENKNVTISWAEYTRLLDLKTRIDVIDELDCIVDLTKEDILVLLKIKEAEKDA